MLNTRCTRSRGWTRFHPSEAACFGVRHPPPQARLHHGSPNGDLSGKLSQFQRMLAHRKLGMYGVSEFSLGGARERCLAKSVKFKHLNEGMRKWAED